MESNNWIFDFITSDVLVSDSFSNELLTKTIGEFSLYCYLLKTKNYLPRKFKKLLIELDKKDISLSYHSVFIKYCLNELDLSNYDVKGNSLEGNFIKSVFFGYKYDWSNLLLQYLLEIQEKGINISNTYYLTHIIFYSTYFGEIKYWRNKSNLKSICIDLLNLSEKKYRSEKNWDILREIYLSQIYINNYVVNDTYYKLKIENKTILSKFGWYLSDGENLTKYEINYASLNYNQKYNLFHTTIISLLLDLALKKHTTKNIVHLADRANNEDGSN